MKRLLRLRLSLLLVGLAAIPLVALPFADQIRAEWKRYWEPKPAVTVPLVYSDFVEVSFAYYELDIVENLDVIPQGCEAAIDYDHLATREHLKFVESVDVPREMVSVDFVPAPPVDRRRRFLEEIAEVRCVMTGPVESDSAGPTSEAADGGRAAVPDVDP